MGASVGGGGRGRRAAIVGINVTPMVDVVLVLLVIMMVSATYIVSQSLKVELPKSASTDEAVQTVAKVIVAPDGTYHFNTKPMADDAALLEEFKRARAENPDLNLLVSADTNALHGKVVHAIDLAKQAGILKFAIGVQSE